MKKDKKSINSEVRLAAKSAFIGNALQQFGSVGFSKPKILNIQGRSLIYKSPTKIGAGLIAAGTVMNIKSLVHSVRAAKQSKTPVRTFVGSQVVSGVAGVGGVAVGTGSARGGMSLLRAGMKTGVYKKAADASKFARAKDVGPKAESAAKAGNWVFRKIRGRIIRIKAKTVLPYGGRLPAGKGK